MGKVKPGVFVANLCWTQKASDCSGARIPRSTTCRTARPSARYIGECPAGSLVRRGSATLRMQARLQRWETISNRRKHADQ